MLGSSSLNIAPLLRLARPAIVLLALALSGCQSAYFNTMEQFGVHKRDLMVMRVESARDAQSEAVEQFDSALAKFQSVVGTSGGDLQKKYEGLNAELESSEARAATVSQRIRGIETVAEALFQEWEAELEQYSNANLRRSSQQQLTATRTEYTKLVATMHRAEAKIEPVLTVFRDQVLFLKHNLNAQAIASLRGELGTIENDVAALVRDMKVAITQADQFIASMRSS